MPPPGYEPFLHAICANPEDDVARLVYADWLDDHGDPDRAGFIRLQVAISSSPGGVDEGHTRAEVLRKKNWDSWRSELPKLSGITWGSYFWRGFIPAVSVSTGKWLIRQRGQIFRSAPIQSVGLNDAGLATLKSVIEIPEMERITSLSLRHCRIREGEWHAVARCTRLIRLKRLQFDVPQLSFGRPVAPFSEEDAKEFVETPHLPQLEALHINGMVSPAALALLRSRFKDIKAW